MNGESRQQIVKAMLMALILVAAVTVCQEALAYSSGAAGDAGYDLWDIIVNKGLKGPWGAAGGAAAVIGGFVGLASGMAAKLAYTIIAVGGAIATPSIVSGFGMIF